MLLTENVPLQFQEQGDTFSMLLYTVYVSRTNNSRRLQVTIFETLAPGLVAVTKNGFEIQQSDLLYFQV